MSLVNALSDGTSRGLLISKRMLERLAVSDKMYSCGSVQTLKVALINSQPSLPVFEGKVVEDHLICLMHSQFASQRSYGSFVQAQLDRKLIFKRTI